jgi:hypothetical protein
VVQSPNPSHRALWLAEGRSSAVRPTSQNYYDRKVKNSFCKDVKGYRRRTPLAGLYRTSAA